MPKSILNGLLFLALWLVAGYSLFQFFQWTEPVLTSWIDLLLYGRITEFWGATRFILWVFLFMLVHLSSYLASLFVGPLILHSMERWPALRITPLVNNRVFFFFSKLSPLLNPKKETSKASNFPKYHIFAPAWRIYYFEVLTLFSSAYRRKKKTMPLQTSRLLWKILASKFLRSNRAP